MEEIDPIRPALLLAGNSRGQAETSARASPPAAQGRPQQAAAVVPSEANRAASSAPTSTRTSAPVRPADLQKEAENALGSLLRDVIGEPSDGRRLRVFKDDDSGRFVYQSVNSRTGEVVRQFPPEEILKLVAQLRDVTGIVLDNRV
ncbi:MAG: flagellar protein FlaG [Rhodothalassiaceae bacterium]